MANGTPAHELRELSRRLRTVKHDIARIYTVIRERELGLSVVPGAEA